MVNLTGINQLFLVCVRLICIGFLSVFLNACGGDSGEGGLDPVIADSPIFYVKRSVPVDDVGVLLVDDARDVFVFNAGADLYLRDSAAPSAKEKNITGAITQGLGDVKDVAVSFDATAIVFALRMPLIEDADDEDQPTWNIWEYLIEQGQLRRVIKSDLTAALGDDVAPKYLTDGRIVFSSNRQVQAKSMLLVEGKPQFSALDEDLDRPASVLHVMAQDGTDIEQISFNQSSDFDPVVLSSGDIVFSRWDNVARTNGVNLYKVNPDGTQLSALYGAHSHDNEDGADDYHYFKAREMFDGRLMVVLRSFESQFGDKLIYIDVENFSDIGQRLPDGVGKSSQAPVTRYEVNAEDGLSIGGRFSAIFPLWDGSNRALVAWAPCRLQDGDLVVPCNDYTFALPNVVEAAPRYGIYIYDFDSDTQLPIVLSQVGVTYTDVVAAHPRQAQFFVSSVADSALVEEAVGLLHIRSVYDMDGRFDDLGANVAGVDSIATLADPANLGIDQRPARFLKVTKAVAIPSRDVRNFSRSAYGVSRGQLMRDVIGYTPIAPDGSVMVKVPANVPLAISVLDQAGRRISARHNNWLQVGVGEVLECNGCHDHSSGAVHGRSGVVEPLNAGAVTSGLPFPNTNPALVANMGETMAQTRVGNACGVNFASAVCAELSLSVDVVFEDVWTDTASVLATPSFAYRYQDLKTPPPTTSACIQEWNADCRTTINYETHIHPLWSVSRQVLDSDGMTVLQDYTCTLCHNIVDAAELTMLPAAQLDLSDGLSDQNNNHFKAYRELLASDIEQELVEGILQDVFVQETDNEGNLLFELDDEGELILDIDDNPIPVMRPVFAPGVVMSARGARASHFLEKMTEEELNARRTLISQFDLNYVDHRPMLNAAELKLISEWLDIGAQYYNNPFDTP